MTAASIGADSAVHCADNILLILFVSVFSSAIDGGMGRAQGDPDRHAIGS